MPTQVLMPALSPTMTEGKIAKWVKNEGDAVASGDVLAEIETDKATMEVEAVDEGILGKILVGAGTENVAVNTPIAIIVDEGEAVPAFHKYGNYKVGRILLSTCLIFTVILYLLVKRNGKTTLNGK